MNATMNPSQPQQADSITLYFREGSSDKVYQCGIEPAARGMFDVNFAYGRRGTTLQTGSKTSSPVKYDDAKRIYDKLVREKTAKGYTPGEDGVPYKHTANDDRVTDIRPQLLNPIDEDEVARAISDPAWCMQEKKDGRRVLLQSNGAAIHGINKKGLLIGLPSPVVHQAARLGTDFIVDGECVGDVFHAFDLLQAVGDSLVAKPYKERLALLIDLLNVPSLSHIEAVTTVFSSSEKTKLFDRLKRDKKEGVVFKRLDAMYTPGRPNSGGTQLKYKFYATLSAVVAKINAQRSVELRLLVLPPKKWTMAS